MSDKKEEVRKRTKENLLKLQFITDSSSSPSSTLRPTEADINSLQNLVVHNEIRYTADHILRDIKTNNTNKPAPHDESLKAYRHSDKALRVTLMMLADRSYRELIIYHDQYRKYAHLLIESMGLKKTLELKKKFLNYHQQFVEAGSYQSEHKTNLLLENIARDRALSREYASAMRSGKFLWVRVKYYSKITFMCFIIIVSAMSFCDTARTITSKSIQMGSTIVRYISNL